tara:strand:- start:8933 stop:10462 length:1530 start_codon:yes stop_codon:yes gene_type:complete
MVGNKTLPITGQEVVVTEDGTDIFKGTIIERADSLLGGQMVPRYFFTCMDGFYEMDRQLVTKAYNNTDAVTVVDDIVTNFMSGFTLNAPTTSPTINTARFNYEQPSRCLTKIAQSIGWDWYVDASSVVHFFPESDLVAPVDIEDDNGTLEYRSLRFDQNVTELRNRVFVRGGRYSDAISSADAVDKYEANGIDQTFPLVYRYENVEITVNDVDQEVGVDYINQMIDGEATLANGTTTSTTADKLVDSGASFTGTVNIGDQVKNITDDTYAIVTAVDSNSTLSLNRDIMVSGDEYEIRERLKDCLYNFQEKLVRFPEGTLVANDVCRVFGDAQIPLIVQAEDPDSIATYGIREGIEIDKSIDSIEEAELLAYARVDQWKEGAREGSFISRETGWIVGQTVTINSTKFNVDTTYKVNKVRGSINGHDQFIYKIDFLKSGQTTFTDIIIGLIGKSREEIEISPNEVLQRFRKVSDAFSFSDEVVSKTSDSPPYHYGPVTTGNEARYNFSTYT